MILIKVQIQMNKHPKLFYILNISLLFEIPSRLSDFYWSTSIKLEEEPLL